MSQNEEVPLAIPYTGEANNTTDEQIFVPFAAREETTVSPSNGRANTQEFSSNDMTAPSEQIKKSNLRFVGLFGLVFIIAIIATVSVTTTVTEAAVPTSSPSVSPSLSPTLHPTRNPTSIKNLDNILEFEAVCDRISVLNEEISPEIVTACFDDKVAVCNTTANATSIVSCPEVQSCSCPEGEVLLEQDVSALCSGESECVLADDDSLQVEQAVLEAADTSGEEIVLQFFEECKTSTTPISTCLNFDVFASCDPNEETPTIVLDKCNQLNENFICDKQPGVIQPNSDTPCVDGREFSVESVAEFFALCESFKADASIFFISTCINNFAYTCQTDTGTVSSSHCFLLAEVCACQEGLITDRHFARGCAPQFSSVTCEAIDAIQVPFRQTLSSFLSEEEFSFEEQDVLEQFTNFCAFKDSIPDRAACINEELFSLCSNDFTSITDTCNCTQPPGNIFREGRDSVCAD